MASVRRLSPDQAKLLALDEGLGVIVTAKGDAVDFVSRFFAPKAGVAEDPVTGSAHCTLVPFWAERLGRFGALVLHLHVIGEDESAVLDRRIRQ